MSRPHKPLSTIYCGRCDQARLAECDETGIYICPVCPTESWRPTPMMLDESGNRSIFDDVDDDWRAASLQGTSEIKA